MSILNFWREIFTANLESTMPVLSKHRTSMPIRNRDIDRSVFYQKVVSINRSLILSKGRMSLNDESFVPIRQRYLYESIILKKYMSKHLASVHHNSSTLKGFFLWFYGSDPGYTTF